MRILITAPSLDENVNVSGISTLVRQIVKHGAAKFVHFEAGRRDGAPINANWLAQQTLLTPRLISAIRREKVDLVHINTALVPQAIVRDAALTTAARIAKRPVLLHLHGGRFLMEAFENKALERLATGMFRRAAKIIVLSEHEKQSLLKRWNDLNIEVLPNAVTASEIPFAEKQINGEKTIIYLGRLHESKGLHEIVEACRILKSENYNFQFRCFGAGALKDFFAAEMSSILGDDFYYGGVIAGAAKWQELAASDVFLLPSRYGEGLPMAMLEAMAAGCVAVAADVASVRHVIRDDANGFMVEPYNVGQIVEKLKTILDDRADLAAVRANARATVEKDFAFDDYISKLADIYARIVETR